MSVAERLADYTVSNSNMAKTLFAEGTGFLKTHDSIQSFRELILDLAVRGQLSKRNSDDADACELLEAVVARRMELIEEGMIRRAPPFRPLGKDAYPFTLPPNWTWVELEFLVEKMGAGSTPLGGKKGYVKDGIAFLRSQNVWNDGLRLDDVARIPPATHERMAGTHIQRGDVLLNITGASIGRCCLVPDDLTDANVSQHVAIVRLIDLRIRSFLHLCMISPFFQNTIMDVQVGVSREGLSMTKLKRFRFPLPPLAEQKRIVSKVDRLMGICDRLESERRETLSLTDRSRRSVLASLTSSRDASELASSWRRLSDHFEILHDRPETLADLRQTILALAVQGKLVKQDSGDEPADERLELISGDLQRNAKSLSVDPDVESRLFAVPSGWLWADIASVFEVSGGITKNPGRKPKKHHFPYLRVANVQRNRLELGQLERFELSDEDLSRWRLSPKDLLVVEGNGSEKEIGRCAIWNGEIEDCVHQNHIIRCRPVVDQIEAFTILFLNSPTGMSEMKRLAITTSGLYSLSVGKIRALTIPVPPRAEQDRIVAKVDHLLAKCDRVAEQLGDHQTTTEQLLTATIHRILNAGESE